MCIFYDNTKIEVIKMSAVDDNEEIDESQAENEERNEEDIFSILVATDIHLGYAEKDPIRGQDSFVTFEEILKIAQREDVDFLLLGGDLFHETRPSTHCLYKCIDLLKKYCLGDRPVQIEFLSDPTFHFSYSNETVNYEDPNLNVGLPVFSIHGNHDDPTGVEQISALNLLASTGLVNYFGKYNNHASVEIEPILLKKGQSQLALYGLSHIKDGRLGRLFLEKNVTFMKPLDAENWFHLLVLHQNRANRGAKTFIPDNILPEMLDLVIWGHEHDCRIEPEPTDNNVYISQPGSSVATSLCQGEAIKKFVGLLKIHKNQFNMSPIPLKTVRPFIYKDFTLKNMDEMRDELEGYVDEALSQQELAEKFVEKEIDALIVEANNLGQEGNLLPLIRLNVGYVDEKQVFNAIRFGQKYIEKVANSKEMVKLRSAIKKPINRKLGNENEIDFVNNENVVPPNRVEDLVIQYFETHENKQLKCLSLKALNESVMRFIDSNDLDAPACVVRHIEKDLRKKLEAELIEIEDVDDFIKNVKSQADEPSLVEKILNNRDRRTKTRSKSDDSDDSLTLDATSDNESPNKQLSPVSSRGTCRPARGPGSRGGRGSRSGRGSRGTRGKA